MPTNVYVSCVWDISGTFYGNSWVWHSNISFLKIATLKIYMPIGRVLSWSQTHKSGEKPRVTSCKGRIWSGAAGEVTHLHFGKACSCNWVSVLRVYWSRWGGNAQISLVKAKNRLTLYGLKRFQTKRRTHSSHFLLVSYSQTIQLLKTATCDWVFSAPYVTL